MFASMIVGLWGWAHKLQESHADASEFEVSLSTLDFALTILKCHYNLFFAKIIKSLFKSALHFFLGSDSYWDSMIFKLEKKEIFVM